MNTTAIVPAYNEEKTIENVLLALLSSKLINKIIVIDDGSADNTLRIIKKINRLSNKIKIIRNKHNLGKGESVKKAVKEVKTDLVFLCDADLVGLGQKHISDLIMPFYSDNELGMTIGTTDGRVTYKRIFNLGGSRIILRKLIKEIVKDPLFKGYNDEIIANDYCSRNKLKIKNIRLKGLVNPLRICRRDDGIKSYIKQCIANFMCRLKTKLRSL